jgi:ABC-type multidrug transport system fused ATPase/permease subunit
MYGILSGLCILLAMISTPAGQIAGSNARNLLHNQLIDSILKNSLHYFQTVPLGRIMNRFSTDMTVIDKVNITAKY